MDNPDTNSSKTISEIRISGTGSFAPAGTVSNDDLSKISGASSEWIFNNLGIKRRHTVSNGEMASDLACVAASRAIEAAGIVKDAIDLIIVATISPDRKTPSTACLTKHKLGIENNCPAFDISAACAGFLYALTTARGFIKAGMYKCALIIGVDVMSTLTDWTRRDSAFFGDGAGAVIVEASGNQQALFSSHLFSETINTDHFTIYPNEQYFTMNAKEVYQAASRVLPPAITALLDKERIPMESIAYIIPHQPSIRLLKNIAENLSIPFEKVKTNMEEYANTAAATIPILLDEVCRRKEIQKNDIILFAAIGAGWVWGAAVYKWH